MSALTTNGLWCGKNASAALTTNGLWCGAVFQLVVVGQIVRVQLVEQGIILCSLQVSAQVAAALSVVAPISGTIEEIERILAKLS
jgi:hypothetical protein